MDDQANNELDLFGNSDDQASNDTVEETTIDYSEQLTDIVQLQQTNIAMVCVLIGLLLAVSLIQIFKRYL